MTPSALASKAVRLGGLVWRVVEHQYTAASRKLVDTQAEQDALEKILEESKPPYPPEAMHLHYLLKTPFRYRPPKPSGSRFRGPFTGAGVFYASEAQRTALAEFSYHRLRFFLASPGTPLPRTQERLTVLSVEYATRHGLDLLRPPLSRQRKQWTNANDYSATQALADAARQAGIDVIRYESVRDTEHAANVALLSPGVFASPKPIVQQTWYMYLAPTEVNCIRAHARGNDERWTFPRSQFGF